jgi:hypothetical protein
VNGVNRCDPSPPPGDDAGTAEWITLLLFKSRDCLRQADVVSIIIMSILCNAMWLFNALPHGRPGLAASFSPATLGLY